MINKVTLIGNLGGDPELKTLEGGATVARFSLATNENYKDKNGEWQTQTEWHNIVVWRDQADRAAAQLKKGMMVYVEGKISYRKYQDQNGQDKYITDIVASSYRKLEKSERTDFGANMMPSEEHSGAAKAAGVSSTPVQEPVSGDDLPF
jgi:single-strand DNA-binding protein